MSTSQKHNFYRHSLEITSPDKSILHYQKQKTLPFSCLLFIISVNIQVTGRVVWGFMMISCSNGASLIQSGWRGSASTLSNQFNQRQQKIRKHKFPMCRVVNVELNLLRLRLFKYWGCLVNVILSCVYIFIKVHSLYISLSEFSKYNDLNSTSSDILSTSEKYFRWISSFL